jgi:hypothetical protein
MLCIAFPYAVPELSDLGRCSDMRMSSLINGASLPVGVHAEAELCSDAESLSAERIPAHPDRWIRWTTTASVLLLAGIAAVVSFRHMHQLALQHGEDPLAAALIPLAVDGTIVTASMSLLHASRCGSRGGLLPWAMLIAGSLASLAANVAVAEPTLIGRMIAGWPSLALIGAYEMLMKQVRATAGGSRSPRLSSTHVSGQAGQTEDPSCAVTHGKGGRDLQRRAWQWAIASRSAEGDLPSGVAIAKQFERSHRWGRMVKRAGLAGDLE